MRLICDVNVEKVIIKNPEVDLIDYLDKDPCTSAAALLTLLSYKASHNSAVTELFTKRKKNLKGIEDMKD